MVFITAIGVMNEHKEEITGDTWWEVKQPGERIDIKLLIIDVSIVLYHEQQFNNYFYSISHLMFHFVTISLSFNNGN